MIRPFNLTEVGGGLPPLPLDLHHSAGLYHRYALGNPLDFVLTGGQASDIGQAPALLELTPEGAEAFVGDKGYDSDALIQALRAQGMQAVIPPRGNRKEKRECDWFVYKERHLIECFFNKIKHYRRIFSRYEKTARNYGGFLYFVSSLIWLR